MDYPDEHETKLPEVAKMRTAMKPYIEQLMKHIATAVPAEDIAKIATQINALQSELATHKELTKEDVNSIVDKSVNKLIDMKKSEPKPQPVQKKSLQDEILKFRPHDQDPSDNVGFYGFVHPSGAYYIVRHDVKENKQRYYVGKGDHDQSWAKRERLKGYGLLSDQWGE